jgi:hypothetical protein
MAKVNSFHTASDWYGAEEKQIYHDQENCGFGARVKRDHNDIPGVGVGRRLCKECARLA